MTKVLNEYAPKFCPGDIVVARPHIDVWGRTIVTTANAVRPLRIVEVREDRDAHDRTGEPGYAHSYMCEAFDEIDQGVDAEGFPNAPVLQQFLQGHLAEWAARREEVIEAYRSQLDFLQRLPTSRQTIFYDALELETQCLAAHLVDTEFSTHNPQEKEHA